MQPNTPVDGSDLHAPPDPRRQHSLAQLSDAELLEGTRRLVGRSNHLLAELLVHLAEVEARGIHRTRACSSLYAYCIYELRFSEDEAFRRVAAARLVKRFPVLLDALASGELHLTGLLMLGPHLTEANLVEVLARAKHRTKRELARLVRILDPLPAVPARIEPLGPAPARLVPSEPTWQEFIDSACPVRELAPGDRPREWTEGANDAVPGSEEQARKTVGWSAGAGTTGNASASGCASAGASGRASAGASMDAPNHCEETMVTAPVRVEPAPLGRLEAERYKVQFTATEEYVRLVEEAKALLSHAVPNMTLEELQMRAMRALVVELKKKKYAASRAPALSSAPCSVNGTSAPAHEVDSADGLPRAASMARNDRPDTLGRTSARPGSTDALPDAAAGTRRERADTLDHHDQQHTRRRGRHIAAAVRRTVFERDGSRCTYLDANGTRCRETHRLEFHHLMPFASGGDHRAANLTLRCAAHNALAAEEDFGRELIEDRKTSLVHEPFGSFKS